MPFAALAFQASGNTPDGAENFVSPTALMLGFGVLSALAFIIAIINFSMILGLRKRAKRAKTTHQDISRSYFPDNDDLHQIRKWGADYEKMGSVISDVKTQLSDFENRLKAFEDDGRVVEFTVDKTDPEPVDQLHAGREMLYAKLPDTNDGFTAAVLSSEQDGEKIYEITVIGESATFEISGDKDAQKYALSDYIYYLGNACIMENAPEKDSRIVTETPGKLSKKGKDWIIADKAQIKFI